MTNWHPAETMDMNGVYQAQAQIVMGSLGQYLFLYTHKEMQNDQIKRRENNCREK